VDALRKPSGHEILSMFELSLPARVRQWLSPLFRHAGQPRRADRPTRRPALEPLDSRLLLSVTTLNNVLTQGDTVTLQPNGQVWRSDPGGTTLIDNGVTAIAAGLDATGQPALFDLKTTGQLYSLTATSTWSLLDSSTKSIATGVVASGQPVLFDLKTNGQLSAYTTGGWTFLAANVSALAQGFDGAGRPVAFELTGSSLYGFDGGTWGLDGRGISMIASGQDTSGRLALFELTTNDTLWAWTAAGGGVVLDYSTTAISTGLGPDGQRALFDFKSNGQVWAYNQDGWLQVTADVAPPPSKGLYFTNQTSKTIYVALDYHVRATATTPEAWEVVGWYVIAPGQTVQVRSSIDNEFYEYYAYTPGGKSWGGYFTLPITYGTFSYNSLDTALENRLVQSGYFVRGFRSLDVGASNVYGNYTVTLSAANAS
jgi:hypothetical protein